MAVGEQRLHKQKGLTCSFLGPLRINLQMFVRLGLGVSDVSHGVLSSGILGKERLKLETLKKSPRILDIFFGATRQTVFETVYF